MQWCHLQKLSQSNFTWKCISKRGCIIYSNILKYKYMINIITELMSNICHKCIISPILITRLTLLKRGKIKAQSWFINDQKYLQNHLCKADTTLDPCHLLGMLHRHSSMRLHHPRRKKRGLLLHFLLFVYSADSRKYYQSKVRRKKYRQALGQLAAL